MQAPIRKIVDNDDIEDDTPTIPLDLNSLVEALEEFRQTEYGGGNDDPPPQPVIVIKERHQLMNPDFWFIFACNTCLFLTFTGFIKMNMFEQLLSLAFFFGIMAMILNLCRVPTEMLVEAKTLHIRLWPIHFGWTPPTPPIFERTQF